MTKRRAKPSVSVVGAGRLGRALAIALKAAGYRIDSLVARRGRKVEHIVGVKQLRKLPSSDVIIVSTPDDAIEEVANQLAMLPFEQAGSVLHTSGALSSAALDPLAARGFHTGSIHPLVSVSEPESGAKGLVGAFYCVEGDPTALRIAKTIVAELKGTSFTIQRDKKALYHAAAVMSSPHVTALFDLALEMLVECGLNRSTARKVLVPLLKSTVANLATSDTDKALTGTFARGDIATVRKHLAALSRPELDEARTVYRLLSLHSLKLAKMKGVDAAVLEQIWRVLESDDER